MLLVAAGLATLVTGLLLRPVLVQGLTPLDELGERMQAISSDTLDSQRVLVQSPAQRTGPDRGGFQRPARSPLRIMGKSAGFREWGEP